MCAIFFGIAYKTLHLQDISYIEMSAFAMRKSPINARGAMQIVVGLAEEDLRLTLA
jgi:hypothetical protein